MKEGVNMKKYFEPELEVIFFDVRDLSLSNENSEPYEPNMRWSIDEYADEHARDYSSEYGHDGF